ncbi:hypothetical protein DFS34DRAFT_645695 [Phlyctochytrium arcticum]|nr:hypothetical protein DFS34DRAFT_645695 [Phlyctochytrium arcticum]
MNYTFEQETSFVVHSVRKVVYSPLPKMVPKCAVHPPRGWDQGKTFRVLRGSNSPPAEAELVSTDLRGLCSLSGDAERQMIPHAVHPPRYWKIGYLDV